MASIQDLVENARAINTVTADIKRVGKVLEALRLASCHESASSVERDLVRLMKTVSDLAHASLNPPAEADTLGTCTGRNCKAFTGRVTAYCDDCAPVLG